MRGKEKYYWRIISLLRIFIILYFVFIPSLSLSSDTGKLIKDIKNYFSNLKTLEANFIQIGPQGNVSKGKIYLDLPRDEIIKKIYLRTRQMIKNGAIPEVKNFIKLSKSVIDFYIF